MSLGDQVDFDLLYTNPMPKHAIANAFTYYQTWWDAPVGAKALLHAAAFAPIGALILKLNAWTESAIFFDGSALGQSSCKLYSRVLRTRGRAGGFTW